jgi:phosphoribosylglycinamide formyltransferase-1
MTLKIGVLGSTKGTDLPVIIESINHGELNGLAKIALVLSDVKDSGILDRARNYGLNYLFVNPLEDGRRIDRELYDRRISAYFEKEQVELITLIGYMRLFSDWMVDKYHNKCMNIHPSLLPSFPGMDLNVHKSVLDYGCKVTGCTLFYVDKGKDTGPIIIQKAVPVLETDTPETLKERVQKAEQEILPEGIKLHAQERLYVEGRRVHIKVL